jgi:hypothetical protein
MISSTKKNNLKSLTPSKNKITRRTRLRDDTKLDKIIKDMFDHKREKEPTSIIKVILDISHNKDKEIVNEIAELSSAEINTQIRDIILANSIPETLKKIIRYTLQPANNARQMYNYFNLYDSEVDIPVDSLHNISKRKKLSSYQAWVVSTYKKRRNTNFINDPILHKMYKTYISKDKNNTCYLCGRQINDYKNLHVEHKIPSDTVTIMCKRALEKREKTTSESGGFKLAQYIQVNTYNNFEDIQDFLYTLFAYAHARCNILKSNMLFVRFKIENDLLVVEENIKSINHFVNCCTPIADVDKQTRKEFLQSHFKQISELITKAKIKRSELKDNFKQLGKTLIDYDTEFIKTKKVEWKLRACSTV